jgi:hypothetical protein
MRELDLAALTPDEFVPLVGQTFSMTGPNGECAAVELWKVRVPERKPPRGFRQPFALEFKPPDGPVLPQGLYRLEHESFRVIELMITPVVAGGGGFLYEAVFG